MMSDKAFGTSPSPLVTAFAQIRGTLSRYNSVTNPTSGSIRNRQSQLKRNKPRLRIKEKRGNSDIPLHIGSISGGCRFELRPE